MNCNKAHQTHPTVNMNTSSLNPPGNMKLSYMEVFKVIIKNPLKLIFTDKHLNNAEIFRSRRWGSSLSGLRTRDPLLGPPLPCAEIFRHACLQSQFHQISPFSSQNRVIWGCREDPPNIFFIEFLIFLLLRSPCKISKL